jgi:glutamate-5-semialdehyde dehydrogenase
MGTDKIESKDLEKEELEESTEGEGQEPEQEELDLPTYIERLLQTAKTAAPSLASLNAAVKNQALLAMAEGLEEASEELIEANTKDLEAFDSNNGRESMADRLRLTPERIQDMASGIREIAVLRDPVGESLDMQERPNGMKVRKIRVPIGVIGIIYESRPNVTADAAALCLKSGNVCVLRGGSEAIHSNTAIANILSEAAEKAGIPPGAISIIGRAEREAVMEFLKRDDLVDLIIPRGGESLMKTVTDNTAIPVIKHDKGVCHVYVDGAANLDMAQKIAFNAKVQRPSTCNAMETLLVHQQIARTFLVSLGKELLEANVEIRGCEKTCKFIPEAVPATDKDYGREFLNLTLAVKVVRDMDQAMQHIQQYGSQHTEVIVTNEYSRALRFMREVDAGVVMVNASSRLNDGYQFGLGAEIGISTTRIHARGPMGLEDLTSSKFIVFGSGQLRE